MRDVINKMKGHLELKIIDRNGNVIGGVDEKNIILNHAKTAVTRLIGGATQNSWAVRDIYVGEDYGSGTPFVPEQPVAAYDETYMDILYQFGFPQVSYPTSESVLFSKLIDGNAIVNAYNTKHASSGETADISSAALITGNGEAVTYKRFPVKVVTRFINVEIRWTLDF